MEYAENVSFKNERFSEPPKLRMPVELKSNNLYISAPIKHLKTHRTL